MYIGQHFLIEAFGLEGAMSKLVGLIDLQEQFERNTKAYIGNSMLQHIPMGLKQVGDYPKKVDNKMPLDKFKNYFVKILYGVHRVVGKDGSALVYGVEFIFAKDVQYSYHDREYDCVECILEKMKDNIGLAQNGEIGSFKFHHYSLLMHLILYKNIGYVSQDFIDDTSNVNGDFFIQLWTWV